MCLIFDTIYTKENLYLNNMVDDAEIKKMPIAERLKLIDELWQTIDDAQLNELSAEDEMSMLEERMDLYEKGKMNFTPWHQVKDRIQQRFK